MQILTDIPTEIFRAIQDGAGRVKLQQTFNISAQTARHYVYMAERSQSSETLQTALVLADLHLPYHESTALATALDYGECLNPDVLLIIGDLVDFAQISFWKNDPTRQRFPDEVESSKAEIRKLEHRFPSAKKIFISGNHELRLTNFLWTKAEELFGLEALSVQELLGLTQNGWEIVDNKKRLEGGQEPFKLGDTYFIHGHEVRCSINVVNIPRIYYSKIHGPVVVAHHHKTQEWNARCMNGDFHRSYSIGCLCNLSPPYNPVNDWNYGLAIVHFTDSTCLIENKKIIDGQVV